VRARRVAERVIAGLAGREPLPRICANAGVSARTLQRTFQREVGMSFELWRRQLRLVKAIELMASGASVKETAFAVGYLQPSALVASFRLTFGVTPKQWIAEHVGGTGLVSGQAAREGCSGAL